VKPDTRTTPVRDLAGAPALTPAGPLTVVFDLADSTVLAAGFQHISDLMIRLRPPYHWHGHRDQLPGPLAEAFERYGDGLIEALDVIVGEQEGSAFRQTVWRTLRGQHQTVSYGQLAELAGAPRAARAVGTACAHNRLALIVPCHRVIRADGGLGQYGYGGQIKTRLLDHERRHR
jgi:methylated-DNA-[protein]-cysteine S-methyltransferase